jgi:hypothetical protein
MEKYYCPFSETGKIIARRKPRRSTVNRTKLGRGAIAALVVASAISVALATISCSSAPAMKQDGKAGAPSATIAVEKARANLDIAVPSKRAEKRPFLMTHYMPWFEAPPVSKNYGWHWHMGYTDPFQTDAKGYAQIATHYYPLTGPYDSTDKDILEYQTLLMRIAGIDGVIIDWYGTGKVLDYPVVHKASQSLFAQIKKAGLRFAVCYEDQSVGKMVEAKAIPIDQSIAAAKESLSWVMANWMKDPAYLTLADRPLLLDFGPQYAKLVMPNAWDQVFAGMTPKPFFDTLDGHMESTADGSFAWPPMYLSGGGPSARSRSPTTSTSSTASKRTIPTSSPRPSPDSTTITATPTSRTATASWATQAARSSSSPSTPPRRPGPMSFSS